MTETIEWQGRKFTFSIGWHHDGTVGEIFIDGHKTGSQIEAAVDEAAIQASYALQSGIRIGELAERSMDTPVGAVLRRAHELESELGASQCVSVGDFERRDGDFYATDARYTRALLRQIRLREGGIAEPACGEGDISRVLMEHGLTVVSSDLFDRQPGIPFTPGLDFLSLQCLPAGVRHIITNPPYRNALDIAFIRHALALTKAVRGLVAMFLPFTFDASDHHREVIADCPIFAAKITVHQRPRWIPGTKGSPRQYFAWFIWDWLHAGPSRSYWVHA